MAQMAEQNQKFDCPEDFRGNEDELRDFPERYDKDGVILYSSIEEGAKFATREHCTVIKVSIQTFGYFNIPQYLWENFRLYKPKKNEDNDRRRLAERERNVSYGFDCIGYFEENSK